ncbi:hypothetical protein BGW80DRAFT_1286300 [Lactifluus volemus]|nr:hypothetical protein BGW80DRAFT_1286300 [Lactifluus volemus]
MQGVHNSRLRYYLLASQIPGASVSYTDLNRIILPHISRHGADWKSAMSLVVPEMGEPSTAVARLFLIERTFRQPPVQP